MIPPRPIIVTGQEPHPSLLEGRATAIGRGTAYAQGTVIHNPLPSILMQAVVTLGERTEEGRIIEALSIPWLAIAEMIEKDPSVVYQIEPRKWEEMIAAWYDEAGFDEVILTPHSGDLGRDVIAVKRGLLTVRFIDQVKANKPGRVVTADEVRALLGVLQADQSASKGIVTTTSDFAPKIKDDKFLAPFMPYRLELVDGAELRRRMSEVAKGRKVI